MPVKNKQELEAEISELEKELDSLDIQYEQTKSKDILKKIKSLEGKLDRRLKKIEKLDNDDVISVSFGQQIQIQEQEPLLDISLDEQFKENNELPEQPNERTDLEKSIKRLELVLGLNYDTAKMSISDLRRTKAEIKEQLLKKQHNTAEIVSNIYVALVSKAAPLCNPFLEDAQMQFVNVQENMTKYKSEIADCLRHEFNNNEQMAQLATTLTSGFMGILAYTTIALASSIEKKQ